MADLYETIRKSMFAYFCKHNSHIIEEKFAVPRKVKIAKKSQRSQPKRYYHSDKAGLSQSSIQISCMDDGFKDQSQVVIDKSVVSNPIC